MADAAEMMLISFIKPAVQCDWGIDDLQGSLITSAVGCGTLIGAVIGGQVADIYGRRAGFLLTGLFVFTAGVLSAFGERGAQPAVACDLWSHAHSVLAFP